MSERVSRMRRTVLAIGVLAAVFPCPAFAAAKLTVRGSAEQVEVTGVKGGARLTLVNSRGRAVKSRRADSLGGLGFRGVKTGHGYRLIAGDARPAPFTVLALLSAPPCLRFYK